MVTMENAEEVMQILERYTRLKQKEIPKELEEYLGYVAKTGDTVFKWSSLKYLFREKLLNVIKQFHDATPRIDEIPQYPNVDPFNYENMKSTLLERLELFNAAPFTVQRLCELLIDPRKQYSRIDKFMRALEKNILVVSTVEPGRKHAESENGDSLDSVVNGDILLDVNVDIDMEADSLLNMETQAQNNTQNSLNDTITTISTAAVVNENDCDNTSAAFSLSSQDDVGSGNDKTNIIDNKESALVKTMATHIADDDILPHPKKVKLDLIDKTQNDELEGDNVGGEENRLKMKSDSFNLDKSVVRQKQEKTKGINEESTYKTSDEQAQNDDLKNKEQQQQQEEQEKPHNLKEAREVSDKERPKANVETRDSVVAVVPVITTVIEEINEKEKPRAATTRITREYNEKNKMDAANNAEQNIDENQKESTVYTEQTFQADKLIKIQTAKEKGQQEKVELEEEAEQTETKEKRAENLERIKMTDKKIAISGQQQQITTTAKDVEEESTGVGNVVEKQELEKCEKDPSNLQAAEIDQIKEKSVREILDKVKEKIGSGKDDGEKCKKVQQKQKEGEPDQERKQQWEEECSALKEEEELLELQLLSNKTEELVEVIENNKMETIHEDLEENEGEHEKKIAVEKGQSNDITLNKNTGNPVIDIAVTSIPLSKEVAKDVTLEKFSKGEKSQGESLVDFVTEKQQNNIENVESVNKEQTHKEKEGNEKSEIDIEVMQSTTKSRVAITASELEILNEIAIQTASTACCLNNETKICETLGMATEIATSENFPQQQHLHQIIGADVTPVAADAAPSITSDSIIILPRAITPTATPTSVLTNILIHGEQPMIEDVTIEEEAPPTVEEVIMAESPLPPSQQSLSTSQQLIESITRITSAPSVMDMEPSSMEIDDTSQEAMDQ